VVVSGKASSIEAAHVVENLKLNIKYIRNDGNTEVSRNIIAIVDLADGGYYILTGDDDRFRDGWFGVLELVVKDYSPNLNI